MAWFRTTSAIARPLRAIYCLCTWLFSSPARAMGWALASAVAAGRFVQPERGHPQVIGGPGLALQIVVDALHLLFGQAHLLGCLGCGNVVLQRVPEQVHQLKRQAEEELFLRAACAIRVRRGRA